MKVMAYKCNLCNRLMNDSDAVGIEVTVTATDLFNHTATYRYDSIAAIKADLHFCTACHNNNVVDLCKHINRATHQEDYTFHYNLYTKKFYELIHRTSLFSNKPAHKRRR
jgi:hypothetical protein